MMPKVSGSVTLWFENIEFEDDGDLCLRDQAIDALKEGVSGDGVIVDVEIDTLDGKAAS
jgi:hypothetical protein